MENRDKILEELKSLKAEGVQIRITESNDGYIILGGSGLTIGGNNGGETAIQRARGKMIIEILENDNEEKIMEKIEKAKTAVSNYKELIKHEKSTPDFLNYLRNNLFVD